MELTINYNAFKSEIDSLISKAKTFEEIHPKSEDELDEFTQEKKVWENSCFTFLQNSFNGDKKSFFAKSFLESNSPKNFACTV